MVQNYMKWMRNRYRYTIWTVWEIPRPLNSYWYYLWSSFKGMELIRQSGIAPTPATCTELHRYPACRQRSGLQFPTGKQGPGIGGAAG